MVRAVSVLQPKKRGQLFHVSNERNSKEQAFKAQAIGIVPGVSDFIYFESGIPIMGLEVKVSKSRHLVSHLQSQVNWGRILEREGGNWRLITDVEQMTSCVVYKILKGYTLDEVQLWIDNAKGKTIAIP